ncbi:unnamed protein product [Choristocarpus tenellus]
MPITAVSLQGRKVLVEVPVGDALTASAWLARRPQPYSQQPWEVWVVMFQALRGLVMLHAAGITHGAVCLENILVAAHVRGSVGGGAEGSKGGENDTGPVGPMAAYHRAMMCLPLPVALARLPSDSLPPEVVKGDTCSTASDMYAFGVALYNVYYKGNGLGTGGKEEEHKRRGSWGGGAMGHGGGVLAGVREGQLSWQFRQALQQLLVVLLADDPGQRPTALEALSSEFFRLPPPGPLGAPVYPASWLPLSGGEGKLLGNIASVLGGEDKKNFGQAEARREGGWWQSRSNIDVASGSVEFVEAEALLHQTLPGSKLNSLQRVEDRGTWLRFACQRDAAAVSTDGMQSNSTLKAGPGGSGGRGDGGDIMGVRPLAVGGLSGLFYVNPCDVGVICGSGKGIGAGGGEYGDAAGGGGDFKDGNRTSSDERKGAGAGSLTEVTWLVRCVRDASFAATSLALIGDGGLRTIALAQVVTGRCQDLQSFGGGGAVETACDDRSKNNGQAASSLEGVGIDDLTKFAALGSERSGIGSHGNGRGSVATGTTTSTSSGGITHDDLCHPDKDGNVVVHNLPGGVEVGLAQPLYHSQRMDEPLAKSSLGGERGGFEHGSKSGERIGYGLGSILSRSSEESSTVYSVRRHGDYCYPAYIASFWVSKGATM